MKGNPGAVRKILTDSKAEGRTQTGTRQGQEGGKGVL
jgi:hypothetical protein